MTFAGIPAAKEYAGISLVTMEPAPIMLPLPTCTPERIHTFSPIHTFSSIIIGPFDTKGRRLGCISSILRSNVPCELSFNITLLPMRTPSPIFMWFIHEILELCPILTLSPISIEGVNFNPLWWICAARIVLLPMVTLFPMVMHLPPFSAKPRHILVFSSYFWILY